MTFKRLRPLLRDTLGLIMMILGLIILCIPIIRGWDDPMSWFMALISGIAVLLKGLDIFLPYYHD